MGEWVNRQCERIRFSEPIHSYTHLPIYEFFINIFVYFVCFVG